ncbi:hypothetical protein DICVIV_11227, partial [Dictyocaulus viviparus]
MKEVMFGVFPITHVKEGIGSSGLCQQPKIEDAAQYLLSSIHLTLSAFTSPKILALVLASSLLPFMSLLDATAFCSFLGLHMNTITVISLAVAFAIGFDGVLMFYNAWISASNHTTIEDRMSEVFSDALPSITIVSSTSLGLLFGTICFLPAVIAWCSPIETHQQLARTLPQSSEISKTRHLDVFLGTDIEKAQKLHDFCVSLVKADIDYRDLLPSDSPSRKGVHFMNDIVWPEFFNVLFFIEKPPRFDDPVEYQRFSNLISEIESLPSSIKNSGMMWINDFKRHTGMVGNETGYKSKMQLNLALNMTLFHDFIAHHIYKAWSSGVRYRTEGNSSIITKMLYIGGFEGVHTMMDKGALLTRCRQILAKYPEFDIVPFDTEVRMVD